MMINSKNFQLSLSYPILIIFLLFLVSCSNVLTSNLQASPTLVVPTSLAATPSPTTNPTLVIASATSTPELTPTAMLSPTKAPTIVPTPTRVTAPVMPSNQVITASNINQITKLGVIGRGTITEFIYSPDGTNLIISTETGIWIYQVDDHSLIKHLPSDEPITSIDITGDSKILFSVGRSGLVNLWNMETFEVLDTFDCGETSLRTLAVSNDGRFLATGGDFSSGRVTIWDLTSRKVIKTHKPHTYDVSGLVFSPDGNLLASAGSWQDNTIRVWNLQSNLERFSAPGHNLYVSELIFSPDGSLLASRGDGRFIKLFDATTGVNLRNLFASIDQGNIVDFAFSNSGQSIMAITEEDLLLSWDVQSGKITSSIPVNCGGYCRMRISPSNDNEISLHKGDKLITLNLIEPESYRILEDHEYIGGSFPQQPINDTLLTISQDRIQEWDLTTGDQNLVKKFDFTGFTLFPDRQKIARVEERNLIRIYELDGMTLINELPLKAYWEIRILSVSPDGTKLVVQTDPGTTLPIVIDTSSGEILYKLTGHTENVQRVLFSDDGQYIISVGQSIILWECSSGLKIGNLVGSAGYNTNVSFTPLTHSAFSYLNGNITFWEIPSRSVKFELPVEGFLEVLSISPDERLLVGITYEGNLLAWDLETKKLVFDLDIPITDIWQYELVFSSNGQMLIFTSDGCITLWGVP